LLAGPEIVDGNVAAFHFVCIFMRMCSCRAGVATARRRRRCSWLVARTGQVSLARSMFSWLVVEEDRARSTNTTDTRLVAE
jgi:hypothetical protein